MSRDTTQIVALLASAADTGDDDAYVRVMQRSIDRLVTLTRRMLAAYPHLHRWEETDDVFQEVSIRLCRSLRELKPRSAEELFALAKLQIRRTLIDLARHHFGPLGQATHHRSDPHLLASEQSLALDGSDGSGEPQSIAEWAEFHEAVGRLPAPEREAFEFVWYAGATYAEAADLMGVARRTVIRRMNRARLRLQTVVSEWAEP